MISINDIAEMVLMKHKNGIVTMIMMKVELNFCIREDESKWVLYIWRKKGKFEPFRKRVWQSPTGLIKQFYASIFMTVNMNAERFIWTSEDYTCEELREQFDNKFPVIALVTTGYYAEKEHENIDADTVLSFVFFST